MELEPLLHDVAHAVALGIEAIAVAFIAVGAIEAVIGIIRIGMKGDLARREVWLRFARWLVAGMTFQLAADVVNTSIAPTWDDVGHLAAIAAVRTFLSYFLDREMAVKNAEQERAIEHSPG